MRHATDADHVIALSTIVSRQSSIGGAALIGAFWGIGHTLTIMLVGTAIIVFNVVIPPRVGLGMELAVGFMLVLLGVLSLTGITRRITERLTPAAAGGHSRPYAHGECVHDHVHGHEPGRHGSSGSATLLARVAAHFGTVRVRLGCCQVLRPLLVGTVHGLAGSAAAALLVLATIRNAGWAVAYLLVFGLGTIAGMMLITTAISVPYAYALGRFTRTTGSLVSVCGLFSVGFGLFIVYQISFAGGIFTSSPHWTPR